MSREGVNFSMEALCALFDLTRQGHWRWAVGEPRQALATEVIVELVVEIRLVVRQSTAPWHPERRNLWWKEYR